jgi:hypothetical protein
VADQQRAGAGISTWDPTEPPPTGIPGHLAAAELVYMKKGGQPVPLAPPYSGPYRVVARTPKYFTLEVGGQEQAVTVYRLKPHTGTAAAPCQGHPPAATMMSAPSLPHRRHVPPCRACQLQPTLPGGYVLPCSLLVRHSWWGLLRPCWLRRKG